MQEYLNSMKNLSIIPLIPLQEMNLGGHPRNIIHIVVEQHGDPVSEHSHYIAKCENQYFHKSVSGKSAADALINLAQMMNEAGFME